MKGVVLIAGGNGLVGRAVTNVLLEEGFSVRWLVRSLHHDDVPRGVELFQWSPLSSHHPFDVRCCDNVQLHSVLFTAGHPIIDGRLEDQHHRDVCMESRVLALRSLAPLFSSQSSLPSLVVASAVGLYGQRPSSNTPCDESTPPPPPSSSCFSSSLVAALEKEALSIPTSSTALLRLPPVLAPSSGAYPRLALPARYGLSAALGSGTQPFPWIHVDDCARFFCHAVQRKLNGAFNVTVGADEQPSSQQLAEAMARSFGMPYWMPNVPEWSLNWTMGKGVADLVTQGKKISNAKMLETGFKLNFPTLDEALRDLAARY